MDTVSEVSTVVLSDLGNTVPSIGINSQGIPAVDDSEQVSQDNDAGNANGKDELDLELVKDSQVEAFRMDNPLMYEVIKKMLNVAMTLVKADKPQESAPALPQMQTATPLQTPVVAPQQTTPTVLSRGALTPETGRAGLERFLAPPRSASSGNNTPEVFTNQQIEQFYRAVASGRYRGRENDARDIELRIARAINEGRVTN
ncbi:MAG: hypothetical protein SFH39_10420 [Candidatus Magnetobacterium sp. LHC-1]|nr:hypothetical protein [Nitrospirota bacterium]